MKKPLVLCILDGFGHNKDYEGNAISRANKPNLDSIFDKYKGIELITYGERVGLPDGQMGNSEVGHTNIGAGRIIYQSLSRINKSIREGDFQKNESFLKAFDHIKKTNGKLHLMGLFSPGGVHSSKAHMFELIKLASNNGIKNINLHLFMDGRDVAPMSGLDDIKDLLDFMSDYHNVKIATISGRYYSMDRDRKWDRINKAYDAMVEKKGNFFEDPISFMEEQYKKNIGDEFIVPGVCVDGDKVEDSDSVIFFNFRPDRAIHICASFTNKDYQNKPNKRRSNLFFTTMTDYSPEVKPSAIAFPLIKHENVLGKVLEDNNLSQVRIAETEKYPHVTFFFDGGEHVDYKNGKKILINSPKVATYDMKPEMSAYEVTDALLKELGKVDVVILNFANCDMVGHTGSIPACIKAVEAVDECVGKLYEKISELGGTLIITADHGNADEMLDKKNNIVTKHSLNPVPFHICKENVNYSLTTQYGKLADIAPTMLTLLGIDIPKEMTGNVLIKVK